jgi:hypothetical protein
MMMTIPGRKLGPRIKLDRNYKMIDGEMERE